MTQPFLQPKPPADRVILHAVYGKDRLFDDWIKFEAPFRWQVDQWAEARAFVRYDMNGDLLVETREPGLARIERKDAEKGWVPYSAPMSYAYQARWLLRHDLEHPLTVGFYRLVEVPTTEESN